jgi:PAS domain S-box-containing protein
MSETADRNARWVSLWREAMQDSHLAIAVVDLSTTHFVALSGGAAELLGTTPEAAVGLSYLTITERPRQAAQGFQMARDGLIHGIRARRRFRRHDGSTVEVELSGSVIRSGNGPDLGLWVASEASSVPEQRPAGDEAIAPSSGRVGLGVDAVRMTLDEHWRVAEVSTDAATVLGRRSAELLGRSLIELTHPGDLAMLLLGFARATTGASIGVRVRVCHQDGDWRTIEVVPTVLTSDERSVFAVVVAPDPEPGGAETVGDASELAGHLRRIADRIEVAGMLAPLVQAAATLGIPTTTDLSPRQWEVASRLLRGERVATIASDMYLSQSTVRNHLSAIFRKVGVHSQQELLALWLGENHRAVATDTSLDDRM